MKNIITVLFLIFSVRIDITIAQEINSSSYLGLKPPGLTPEVFLPRISFFENRDVVNLSFSSDGRKIYFTVGKNVYMIVERDGVWSEPEFTASIDSNTIGPKISSGSSNYFYGIKGDIWEGELHENVFLDAQKLPEQINSDDYECDFSITKNDNIYFASGRSGTKGRCDIFCSKFKDGRYQQAENLDILNTPLSECGLFVSPDEDYIIFTSFNRPGGLGSNDLYISFATDKGWSSPQNMGTEINTEFAEWPITISPDGKYFFLRKGIKPDGSVREIFWVDVKAFEKFRPETKQ